MDIPRRNFRLPLSAFRLQCERTLKEKTISIENIQRYGLTAAISLNIFPAFKEKNTINFVHDFKKSEKIMEK